MGRKTLFYVLLLASTKTTFPMSLSDVLMGQDGVESQQKFSFYLIILVVECILKGVLCLR